MTAKFAQAVTAIYKSLDKKDKVNNYLWTFIYPRIMVEAKAGEFFLRIASVFLPPEDAMKALEKQGYIVSFDEVSRICIIRWGTDKVMRTSESERAGAIDKAVTGAATLP